MSRSRSIPVTILLFGGLVLSDQLLKHFVNWNLRIYDKIEIFGQNLLLLTRVRNSGIAGGRYSALPYGQIEFYTRHLPAVMLGALFGVAILSWRRARGLERISLILLTAGGSSNLWDHWRKDWVVDTLMISMGDGRHLPFNMADVFLILGGIGFIACLLAQWRVPAPQPPAGQTSLKTT